VCLDPTLHPCPRAALLQFRQALWMLRSLAKRRLTTGPGHLWLDSPRLDFLVAAALRFINP
jgi:hypothetical protein